MHKSFLKWAGNKFRVLPDLLPHIGSPKKYIEPFGGSLSVALNINAEEYILNDINQDLYSLYTNVDEKFVNECKKLFTDENNTKEKYLELRKSFNTIKDCRERAKLFLYLNKHAFNGLSRYNSKGEYNVPYGRIAKDSKTGEKKITKAHFPEQELNHFRDVFLTQKVNFFNTSFSDKFLYQNIESGDVIYFDPPYVPASETASFTDYAKEGFTYDQQVELVELAKSLAQCGAKTIISNHDVPATRELYKDAEIYSIQVRRSISANKTSRKKVNELIAIYEL
jgi:DNA adenine methylase